MNNWIILSLLTLKQPIFLVKKKIITHCRTDISGTITIYFISSLNPSKNSLKENLVIKHVKNTYKI